jgi:hypothetical protein
MIDTIGALLMDRVAGTGHDVVHHRVGHGAPDVAMLVVDEILDGTAPGWCVPHQTADETQAPRIAPLPSRRLKCAQPVRAALADRLGTEAARTRRYGRTGKPERLVRPDVRLR